MGAKEILMKAVQCDQENRILEAKYYYEEGIELLINLAKVQPKKKKDFLERIQDYFIRAKQIEQRIQNHVSQGELMDHIPIENNATGYSFKTLFGKYITPEVKEVLIEEPYLGWTESYQFQNLIALIELLVKQSNNLKFISLTTKTDPKNASGQKDNLQQIKDDLAKRGITLIVKYDASLHDRKIVLSNGYIIKIGRGLHFFKANDPVFSLGLNDYDFKKCYKTDVDIWRTKSIS